VESATQQQVPHRGHGALCVAERSCLLLVDLQLKLLPAIADGPAIVDCAYKLTQAANRLGVPVLLTEQNSQGLGHTVDRLAAASNATFHKMAFDATSEAGWPDFLPRDISEIVVVGSEAHVCVLQTVIGLLQAGFTVRVVQDAVGSRTQENKQAGLRRAERYGADIVMAEMVIFEWLRSCNHAAFRDLLKLVK